jgi:hypothetical protein
MLTRHPTFCAASISDGHRSRGAQAPPMSRGVVVVAYGFDIVVVPVEVVSSVVASAGVVAVEAVPVEE